MLKLNIKGTNIKLDPEIYSYIEEKIGSLDKFIEKADPTAQAWVDIGISNKHHQSGKIYCADVQIRLSGRSLRTEAFGNDIFNAIDVARDELQRGLSRYKQKKEAIFKRGGRILKKALHFSRLARLLRKGRIKEEGQ